MLSKLIKEEEKSLASMLACRKSLPPLTFEHQTFDHWLKEHCRCKGVEGKGTEDWKDFLVQNIDYLANPSIQMKNTEIIRQFQQHYT